MSLQPQLPYVIPDETRRAAHAAFPKGALGLRLVETVGQLYLDEQFTALFPTRGQSAASPARLALVLVLQYVEGLSDRRPLTPCAAGSRRLSRTNISRNSRGSGRLHACVVRILLLE